MTALTIGKTRISRTEKWCAQNVNDLRLYPKAHDLPGLEVEVILETMQESTVFHGNREVVMMRLTDQSALRFMEVAGITLPLPTQGLWLCQCMLEISVQKSR